MIPGTSRAGIAVVLLALAAVAVSGCDAPARSQMRPAAKRPATSPPRSPTAPPLRIMPLGDSITDGLQVPGGYRTDLWQFMAADGMAADFVGSQAGGPAQLPDRDNEGHPGWRVGQIYLRARSWLRAYRPQVILLHLGTNDVLQDKELTQAPWRLSALLKRITSTLPGARVYVATIGPFARTLDEERAKRFNAALPAIVTALSRQGRHVRLVNMHAALRKAELSPDGIHPSVGGYSKMAAMWYSALVSTPIVRHEAEDPAQVTVNNGVRLPTRAASGNGKVGYLNYADSHLDLALNTDRAGRYRLYVHAADGMGRPCALRLSVDGAPHGELSFTAYGWDQWTIRATDVTLAAGRHTIRLSRGDCSTEVDAIDVRVLH